MSHPNRAIMAHLIALQKTQHSIFAAVVDPDMQIVSLGKTTVNEDCDPTAHAEVNALRAACKTLNQAQLPPNYWLYTTFQPCPLCTSAAVWAGVDGIVYANHPDFRGQEANWSFLEPAEILPRATDIHTVKLIERFMIEDIQDYFL